MSKKHRINQKFYFGRPVWRNSTKTLKVHPLKYYLPQNKQDIVSIIKEGIANRVNVRAVGSGHSYSKAPAANGLLVDMSDLDQVVSYTNFVKPDERFYFEVDAGTTVRKLNKKLDGLGYCISAMGGIDHQTIGGAISTGTHGSSLKFGAMSKMVRSIVLISHDYNNPQEVKTYRIEPSEGFSSTENPEEKLIKDDDLFQAALVCFGSLGIIYSYVLEVEPMYYLTESKQCLPWKELKEDLKSGLLEKHDSSMVLINPYTKGDQQLALLTTHNREVKGLSNLMMQKLKRKWFYGLRRFSRSFLYELISRFPFLFWFSVWGFNKKPENVGKLLDTAIKSQKDEAYYNKGYEVMYQGLDYIKERAYDCEFAVPMAGDQYLVVLDKLMQFLNEINEQYQLYISSPIGLRFVAKSEALITPEHGTDVCYIDTPILLQVYGRETILDKIQGFMLEQGAIPHWGKLNNRMDSQYVNTKFPKIAIFKEQLRRFNPKGLFSNEFTRQMLDH